MIKTHTDLRTAINSRYKSNREFIEAFEQAGGVIDETVLSRQLNGSRGLSSAWLSAYNIFFNKLNSSKMKTKQITYKPKNDYRTITKEHRRSAPDRPWFTTAYHNNLGRTVSGYWVYNPKTNDHYFIGSHETAKVRWLFKDQKMS